MWLVRCHFEFISLKHYRGDYGSFQNLFSDWVGILSFGVIAFIIVMSIFFIVFFMGKSAGGE